MSVRTAGAALLLLCAPIVGCGTVANLATPGPEEGGKLPFGGVKRDMERVKLAANGELDRPHSAPASDHRTQVAHLLLWAADLPFSFIGDVVTWPYTAAYTYINQPTLTVPALVEAGPIPPAGPTADGKPQLSQPANP